MNTLALAADLGIETATELKQQLAGQLSRPEPIQLDAGSVQRVHTASFQLLCSFVRERTEAGLATGFSAASSNFQEAARLLGIASQLGLNLTDKTTETQEKHA